MKHVPKEEQRTSKANCTADYGNFLKSSTLFNGTLKSDKNCDEKQEKKEDENPFRALITDEELFKACGNRTAHKGARHGLTLNGKLERIAQQEQQLLVGLGTSNASYSDRSKHQKKNTFMKTSDDDDDDDDDDDEKNLSETDSNANTICHTAQVSQKIPKTATIKRKEKKQINRLLHRLSSSCTLDEVSKRKNEKKENLKRKRSEERDKDSDVKAVEDLLDETDKVLCTIPYSMHKKMKSKEKYIAEVKKAIKSYTDTNPCNVNKHFSDCSGIEENCTCLSHKKKKKKSKSKESKSINIQEDVNLWSSSSKKFKKVHNVVSSNTHKTKSNSKRDYETITETFSEKEARRLNYQINKKKAKLHSEDYTFLKLSKNLMNIHLDVHHTKKSKRKSRWERKLKNVTQDLINDNLTENVSEYIKKSRKKKDKKSKSHRKHQ